MNVLSIGLAALLAVVPASDGTVSVAYSGSLVRVMEGPLAASLRRHTGLQFQGEAKGSDALANLIAAGLRVPDAFISADAQLLDGLMHARSPAILGYAIFGSARMVVAYSAKSPHRKLFQAVSEGKRSILDVLSDPAIRVGRTDPQLDPKGARTVRVLQLLGRYFHNQNESASVLRKAQTFPEEDLAVRVESAELDAGFFYSTEIPGRGLRTVELPARTNLSQDITYSIARLQHAPDPRAAKIFMDFVLSGDGKAILEHAGVRYFARARIVGRL